MLTAKELSEIKQELDNCNNPVFLYDNDADGLCSFLLLYKYKKAGHGFRHLKNLADEREAERIKSFDPDKVFILDVPQNKITQDFIDSLKVPVIHIEHHIISDELKRVKTFNPTIKDRKDNPPTSSLCYNVVKDNLWLAAIGILSDWHLTEETKQFSKKYPDLLDPEIKDPGKALYESKLGKLAKIIDFNLKGESKNVKKSIFLLQKIKDPYEIIEQTKDNGKKLYKRYEEVDKEYRRIYTRALEQVKEDKLIFFMYEEEETSFSGEIANELLYHYPKKIVFIARKKKGEIETELRCSIRSAGIEVRSRLLKALKGIEGHGGGHAQACGATIKARDFDVFIERFKALL